MRVRERERDSPRPACLGFHVLGRCNACPAACHLGPQLVFLFLFSSFFFGISNASERERERFASASLLGISRARAMQRLPCRLPSRPATCLSFSLLFFPFWDKQC